MKSFLQTTEWLKFQESVGHKTWRFDDGPVRDKTPQEVASADAPEAHRTSNGITANIIKLDLPLGKSLLYIPHGPEISLENIKGGLQNELTNFVKYLKDLARQEKSIFIKIEPISDIVAELLYRKGFKRSNKQIQPYRTVVIDLNLPEEHLLGRMHQKTRYNINLSEKKGLELEESDDVEIFWKLLKQTAKKDQFSTHPKEYYGKLLNFFKDSRELQAKLFLVRHGNDYIGGAVVMIHHNTAYYLHGAMDREYRSLMAPYFMHWEIIKWLKSVSLPAYQLTSFKYYDLWGIDAKKWPGVTRFKLGWGGDLKEYPGSFDLPVSRFWYIAYSIARKVL